MGNTPPQVLVVVAEPLVVSAPALPVLEPDVVELADTLQNQVPVRLLGAVFDGFLFARVEV